MWLRQSHGRERAQTHHVSRLLRSHVLVMTKVQSGRWNLEWKWNRKVQFNVMCGHMELLPCTQPTQCTCSYWCFLPCLIDLIHLIHCARKGLLLNLRAIQEQNLASRLPTGQMKILQHFSSFLLKSYPKPAMETSRDQHGRQLHPFSQSNLG